MTTTERLAAIAVAVSSTSIGGRTIGADRLHRYVSELCDIVAEQEHRLQILEAALDVQASTAEEATERISPAGPDQVEARHRGDDVQRKRKV